MIEAKNLTKKYADGTLALKNVSFKMDKNITAILGRNGAGKTTLLRILSTQLLPTSGIAYINGLDVVKDAEKIRKIIVSIPQEAHPIRILTPLEHVITYLAAKRVGEKEATQRAEKVLKKLEMSKEKNKLAGDLSGGMKRKIFVAMALASNAEVIFLDEPTTGLDPISRMEVWSAIRELKGKTIITTHYLDEAKELADEIIIMEGGKIEAQGNLKQILKPFKKLARIEGKKIGKKYYKFGNTIISYVNKKNAKGLKGKPITLEDAFILKGIKNEP